MLDIIIDTLIDGLKLIPFLFIAFLIIELLEHKLSKKNRKLISKTGKLGPIFGSILGAFPQCGFSCLATNLYVTRIVSLGTLISIYLSTSDEMLPVLLSQKAPVKVILSAIIIKVIIGMISGIIIDFILRKKEKNIEIDNEICHEENCHCKDHLLVSVLKHTLSITLFIMLISFILNILIDYTGIFDENNIIANNPFTVFITSLIGLVPNCASSVMITTLYAKGVIDFSALISGLLTGSGVAIIILFKSNKNIKENIIILSLVYFIGVISGLLIQLLGVHI